MPTPSPNSNPDSFFIQRVRRDLKDWPTYPGPEANTADGTSGALAANAKVFRTKRSPVIKGSLLLSAPGGPWTVVYDQSPSSSQVEVVTETGEIIFGTAPPSGAVSWQYQAVRHSDQKITDALMEGLAHLWPDIWQPALETSIVPSPTTFEYTLPQQLQDPRIVILKVEIRSPNVSLAPWLEYPTHRWRRVGLTSLTFDDLAFTSADAMRLTYNAPYYALADVESQAMHLAQYWALGKLLADEENYRLRSDELASVVGGGALPPGTAMNLSQYWFNLFEKKKTDLSIGAPVTFRSQPPPTWPG